MTLVWFEADEQQPGEEDERARAGQEGGGHDRREGSVLPADDPVPGGAREDQRQAHWHEYPADALYTHRDSIGRHFTM